MDEGCKRAAELSRVEQLAGAGAGVECRCWVAAGLSSVFVCIIMVSVSLMTSTVTTMDWGCVNTARSS